MPLLGQLEVGISGPSDYQRVRIVWDRPARRDQDWNFAARVLSGNDGSDENAKHQHRREPILKRHQRIVNLSISMKLHGPSVCQDARAAYSPALRATRKLRIRRPAVLTHRIATHLDAVSIVDEAVENAVGRCRIAGETGSCEVRIVERTW